MQMDPFEDYTVENIMDVGGLRAFVRFGFNEGRDRHRLTTYFLKFLFLDSLAMFSYGIDCNMIGRLWL